MGDFELDSVGVGGQFRSDAVLREANPTLPPGAQAEVFGSFLWGEDRFHLSIGYLQILDPTTTRVSVDLGLAQYSNVTLPAPLNLKLAGIYRAGLWGARCNVAGEDAGQCDLLVENRNEVGFPMPPGGEFRLGAMQLGGLRFPWEAVFGISYVYPTPSSEVTEKISQAEAEHSRAAEAEKVLADKKGPLNNLLSNIGTTSTVEGLIQLADADPYARQRIQPAVETYTGLTIPGDQTLTAFVATSTQTKELIKSVVADIVSEVKDNLGKEVGPLDAEIKAQQDLAKAKEGERDKLVGELRPAQARADLNSAATHFFLSWAMLETQRDVHAIPGFRDKGNLLFWTNAVINDFVGTYEYQRAQKNLDNTTAWTANLVALAGGAGSLIAGIEADNDKLAGLGILMASNGLAGIPHAEDDQLLHLLGEISLGVALILTGVFMLGASTPEDHENRVNLKEVGKRSIDIGIGHVITPVLVDVLGM